MSGDLYREARDATDADRMDLVRMRSRFPNDLSELRSPPRARRLAWLAPVALAAAAALLVLRQQPADPPISHRLESVDKVQSLGVGVALAMDYQGSGLVEGTARKPVIGWEQGLLVLDVDPEEHIALTVNTQEARVRVKGTVLSVRRDPLGTRVAVDRGLVGLTCAGGEEIDLAAGEEGLCLPVSAGGLLGRARYQLDSGAPPDQVMATIEQGLALPGAAGPRGGELRVLRLQLLVATGEAERALAEARDYLAGDPPLRRAEVAELALNLAVAAGDCGDAPALLEVLGPDADEQQREAARRCMEQTPR